MALTLPIVAVISILVLTGIIWILNKVLPWRVCAICVGVSATWFWMIGALMLGYNIDVLVPAVLMGGSVVGLAYQLETKLPRYRSALLWKSLFIPAGFLAVFNLLAFQWLGFMLALIILVVIAGSFFYVTRDGKLSREVNDDARVSELEREMDKCC